MDTNTKVRLAMDLIRFGCELAERLAHYRERERQARLAALKAAQELGCPPEAQYGPGY